MKILIICGHGEGDSGAVATHKKVVYKESTLTRKVGKALKKKLKALGHTATLYNTNKNAFIQLGKGATINFKKYDLVLELHFNAVKYDKGDGKTKGTEIYISSLRTKELTTKEELLVAKMLYNMEKLGFTNRGLKKASFRVINKATQQGTLALLIETCFIDDYDDMKIYLSNFNNIINAIATACDSSYIVRILKKTTVYKTPSKKAKVVQYVNKGQAFTITEECKEGSTTFGKLKSGAGYIVLSSNNTQRIG